MLYFFLHFEVCAMCSHPQVMDSLNNQKEHMKQSVKKWNSEKSANEEYIAQVKRLKKWIQKTLPYAKINPKGKKWIFENTLAQMRANKEARKREMEEMERMKAQMLEEEESKFFNWK